MQLYLIQSVTGYWDDLLLASLAGAYKPQTCQFYRHSIIAQGTIDEVVLCTMYAINWERSISVQCPCIPDEDNYEIKTDENAGLLLNIFLFLCVSFPAVDAFGDWVQDSDGCIVVLSGGCLFETQGNCMKSI